MIWELVKMFGPDASPITRILLYLLGSLVLGCHAVTLTKPTLAANDTFPPPVMVAEGMKQKASGVGLTCLPHPSVNCTANPVCTYEWYVVDGGQDKKLPVTDTFGGNVHGILYVPRNGAYKCKTVKGSVTSDASDAMNVTKLPPAPAIKIIDSNKKCGDSMDIICTAASSASGTTPTKYLAIVYKKAGVRPPYGVAEGPRSAGQTIKGTVNAYSEWYAWCLAYAGDDGTGFGSFSKRTQMTCNELPFPATSPATESTSDGGNNNDDSGAPDLGRPAAMLTIVCPLLALPLSRRG